MVSALTTVDIHLGVHTGELPRAPYPVPDKRMQGLACRPTCQHWTVISKPLRIHRYRINSNNVFTLVTNNNILTCC